MREETVARNYAETLFELGERHGKLDEYADGIEGVGRLLEENPEFRTFLETPRIDAVRKKEVVRSVFGERLPAPLVSFILVTIDKRRQGLLRAIAREFGDLMDRHHGRIRVDVTVARELGEAALEEMTGRLSGMLGLEAVPNVRVRPEILGGVVVRAGDTIYDGSLRRKLERMRRRLLTADLPSPEAVGLTPRTE